MKLLYLSYLTDEKIFKKIFDADIEPAVARHKLETVFMKTLLHDNHMNADDITIISSVPYNRQITERPSKGELFGKTIDYIWWEKEKKSILQAMITVRNKVNDWYKETEGEKRIILTYATNPIFLLPVMKRKCKMVTFCSEVPRFRVMGNSLKAKLKKEYYHFMNERMDGYIFFSKYMNRVCNKREKANIVVEGLPEIIALPERVCKTEDVQEQIFYAGGMNRENGILELLEGFVLLKRNDVQLILCGVGNVEDQVKEYANKYSNISYLGSVENAKVLEMEQKATLLVNPRKKDEEMTKYSFPSKTFEYFCSGTPCMITRLDGIPEEYFQCCYECDSTSAETLCKSLEKALSVPLEERYAKAMNAYSFIQREKTAEKQVKKIIDFLIKICKEN